MHRPLSFGFCSLLRARVLRGFSPVESSGNLIENSSMKKNALVLVLFLSSTVVGCGLDGLDEMGGGSLATNPGEMQPDAGMAGDSGTGGTSDAGSSSDGQDGGSSGSQPNPPGEPSELVGITEAHNVARREKGLADLVWDEDLAAIAQAWGDGCVFQHNPNRSDNYPGYVGENLYATSASSTTGEHVVTSWVSEEQYYDYATNSCSGVCGHYTQVVWSSTTKVGCAISYCNTGQWPRIVTCNYSPGGNYVGQRPY